MLLGVSYLQSRWDAHDGAPSVTGGYGPMHLTDARTALASAGHHATGSEDPRGDDARAALRPSELGLDTAELPDRLTTLPRAARLTGLDAETLREDPAANVAGGAALLAEAQRRWAHRPATTRPTGSGRWRCSPAPTTAPRRRPTRTRCSR